MKGNHCSVWMWVHKDPRFKWDCRLLCYTKFISALLEMHDSSFHALVLLCLVCYMVFSVTDIK